MDHLILALPGVSQYLDLAFIDGSTPREHVARRLDMLLERYADRYGATPAVTVVGPGGTEISYPCRHRLEYVHLDTNDGASALKAVGDAVPPEHEHVLWIDGDAPFFSPAVTRYLGELHRRSWCDYTFGDGFPRGYAPQFVRRDVIPALATLAESRGLPWSRTLLFDALSVDINAFDVETEATTEDYSLLRVELTVDSRPNYILCRRLAEEGVVSPSDAGPDTPDPFKQRFPDEQDQLLRMLMEKPLLLRTAPRYYHVQITTNVTQTPSYQPPYDSVRGSEPGDMPEELLESVVDRIARETPEATVALGYRGEPGIHRDLAAVARIFDRYPELTVFVETSGIGWSERNLQALEEWRNLNAIIVEVDAAKRETYQRLRGEGWDEVLSFIHRMREVHPGKVYAQATRMEENEWELQEFFKTWSDVPGVEPLIQKYNSFAGRLPDRRVADLEPLKRVPCRHLERDMVILGDGSVPRCHQDLDREVIRGSLATDDLESVWARGAEDFRTHTAARSTRDYPEICGKCDEYYTINA